MDRHNFGVVTTILLKTDPSLPEKQNGQVAPELEDKEKEQEDWFVCRNCGQRLTQPSDETAIQGSHTHTFANPSGFVYEIVCFATARGYSFLGPPSKEFTWFAGHSWRIAICADCLIHLGWYFTSQDGGSFFGFIVDRITRQGSSG